MQHIVHHPSKCRLPLDESAIYVHSTYLCKPQRCKVEAPRVLPLVLVSSTGYVQPVRHSYRVTRAQLPIYFLTSSSTSGTSGWQCLVSSMPLAAGCGHQHITPPKRQKQKTQAMLPQVFRRRHANIKNKFTHHFMQSGGGRIKCLIDARAHMDRPLERYIGITLPWRNHRLVS